MRRSSASARARPSCSACRCAQVLPVSAQKGLQAKIRRDAPLLQASRLPALEAVLGEGLLGKRETMLRLAVDAGIAALRTEAARILNVRQRDLSEQALELQGLRGKNVSVIRHMRTRIEQEQTEFEGSNTRILALRSVQGKLLREVYAVLGSTALKADMGRLAAALKRPGIKFNVRKVYAETFDALRNNLREVQATTRRDPVDAARHLPPAQRRARLHAAGAGRARPDGLRAAARARSSAATSSTSAWATCSSWRSPTSATSWCARWPAGCAWSTKRP